MISPSSSATESVAPRLRLGPGVGRHPARALAPRGEPATPMAAYLSPADALRAHAGAVPEQTALYFVDGKEHCSSFTYRELYAGARRAAWQLREAGVLRGDRVGICAEDTAAALRFFLGCGLLGATPFMLQPPSAGNRAGWAAAVGRIVQAARGPVIVADRAAEGPTREACAGSAGPRVMVADVAAEGGSVDPELAPCPGDVAFLQFTSGTTGNPKGARISNRALLANARAIGHAAAFRTDDLVVSWLPLHHDMGLAGAVLAPLLHRVPTVMLRASAFVARPARWLWAIHHFRATHSAAPNFAYRICADRIGEGDLDGLDLRAWRVACNGAEVVYHRTIRDFCRKYERYGLDPRAVRPVYGLGEFVLMATSPTADEAPTFDVIDGDVLARTGDAVPCDESRPSALTTVSVGTVVPGHELRIVDDDGCEIGDRRKGEVLLRGSSLFDGYIDDGANAEAPLRDGWLHTGDVGYRVGGRLFLCGRKKEILIRGGRNYDPFLLEEAASTVDGVRMGAVAAFAFEAGGVDQEQVALVVEMSTARRGALDEVLQAIRTAVFQRVGWAPEVVSAVPPGSLPRTTSGKVQRRLVKRRFQEQTLRLLSGGGADEGGAGMMLPDRLGSAGEPEPAHPSPSTGAGRDDRRVP